MAEPHLPATRDAEEGHAAPGHSEMIGATADHGGGHVEPTALGFDASGWIALAMLAVFALMIWKKVPAAIGRALDRKIASIREQLDEAAQLRAEAEALRNEYEAKAARADDEAAAMLERARSEAEGIVRQAEANAASLVDRRMRMAEDKIAAAERAAIDEVRAAAAATASAAAEKLLRERLDKDADRAMIGRTIESLARPH